jgi:hypothetical protein
LRRESDMPARVGDERYLVRVRFSRVVLKAEANV